MSQPAPALTPLPFELVTDDGDRLESDWHAVEMQLLRILICQAMAEQGRTDFFCGTDMFVYYSVEQAWRVSDEEKKGLERRAFRGPDVFWIGGVDPTRDRQVWIAWEEDGRLPDVIIELLSPSTAQKDRTEKRDLYARVFGTAEYFLCDPDTGQVEGLRLAGRSYRPIEPDEHGRLPSEQLGVSLGTWRGELVRFAAGVVRDWVRLFRPDGSMIPTPQERADAAEAELARLRALLDERREF
ncbi:MAG TPA: Uma2 family endonuclease [Thermoanaerobaculia bacterium]|nr:Uma2 family endonuclease [Thermoanaerobaculia bacterium]